MPEDDSKPPYFILAKQGVILNFISVPETLEAVPRRHVILTPLEHP